MPRKTSRSAPGGVVGEAMTDGAAVGAEAIQARPEAEPEPTAINQAIARWYVAHIHGSPVSQHTPALNHLQSVLPQLEAEISASITKES